MPKRVRSGLTAAIGANAASAPLETWATFMDGPELKVGIVCV